MSNRFYKICLTIAVCFGVVACGASQGSFGTPKRSVRDNLVFDTDSLQYESENTRKSGANTIWAALRSPNQNTNVRVNKYLWNASLETLSFLPVEAADPFTGVLVMGWGRAPGSSRQYRATVLVQDPALDARSLKLSIQTRGGTASSETVRRIEDAILTRARQLRIRDKKL